MTSVGVQLTNQEWTEVQTKQGERRGTREGQTGMAVTSKGAVTSRGVLPMSGTAVCAWANRSEAANGDELHD